MIEVRFIRQFDWPFVDPYCNCKKVVSYKEGWSGLIHDDVANAAIEAKKAERIGNPSDEQGDTPSVDIQTEISVRRRRSRSR